MLRGCALRCTEYEDILDVASIYSLLALAASLSLGRILILLLESP